MGASPALGDPGGALYAALASNKRTADGIFLNPRSLIDLGRLDRLFCDEYHRPPYQKCLPIMHWAYTLAIPKYLHALHKFFWK